MNNTAEKIARFQALMDTLDPTGPPLATFAHRASISPCKANLGIAVLDASFNPLTVAHEQLAVTAHTALNLGEIILMLSRTNVDKDVFGASLGQRLAMLEAYAQTHPHISVAGCSHARFVDKAQALRSHYAQTTPLYFIIGYDTLIRLFDPKYYANMTAELTPFFEQNHVAVANRGPHDRHAVETFFCRPECAPFSHHLHPVELPENIGQISSTQVRQRVHRGLPIDHLVPSPILQAITHLNLYTS